MTRPSTQNYVLPTLDTVDDLVLTATALSTADATVEEIKKSLQDRVLVALGNALVIVIQERLDQQSSQEDVELFYEVYGRARGDSRDWVLRILKGLRQRGFDAETVAGIADQALERVTGSGAL